MKKKIELKAKAEKNIESGIAITHRFSDRTVTRERKREKAANFFAKNFGDVFLVKGGKLRRDENGET